MVCSSPIRRGLSRRSDGQRRMELVGAPEFRLQVREIDRTRCGRLSHLVQPRQHPRLSRVARVRRRDHRRCLRGTSCVGMPEQRSSGLRDGSVSYLRQSMCLACGTCYVPLLGHAVPASSGGSLPPQSPEAASVISAKRSLDREASGSGCGFRHGDLT
jgi:hypothetical protein